MMFNKTMSVVTRSAGFIDPKPRSVASSTLHMHRPIDPNSAARRCDCPIANAPASIPSAAEYAAVNGTSVANAAAVSTAPYIPSRNTGPMFSVSPAPTL